MLINPFANPIPQLRAAASPRSPKSALTSAKLSLGPFTKIAARATGTSPTSAAKRVGTRQAVRMARCSTDGGSNTLRRERGSVAAVGWGSTLSGRLQIEAVLRAECPSMIETVQSGMSASPAATARPTTLYQ